MKMELWIRSQDKENLIQPTRLFIAFDKNIATWDGNIMIDLGNYETKERALEVLDEIQDELIGSDFMPIEKNEEVVLTCGSAKIYEMPEK